MVRAIGILALQGDFEAHGRALAELDVAVRPVRHPDDLGGLAGLILPGGESTTFIKLMREIGLADAIRAAHAGGLPLFGTCAGAILLAVGVSSPWQFSLGLLDIDIERNAYGRQVDSFVTASGRTEPGSGLEAGGPEEGRIELVFIRAPRIRRCGPEVRVLVRHESEPVLVRQASLLAATFHPELGPDRRIHRYFAEMALGAGLGSGSASRLAGTAVS